MWPLSDLGLRAICCLAAVPQQPRAAAGNRRRGQAPGKKNKEEEEITQVDRADVAFLVKAVDFVIIADDFDQRDGALNLEIFTSSKDGMLPRNVYFLFTL